MIYHGMMIAYPKDVSRINSVISPHLGYPVDVALVIVWIQMYRMGDLSHIHEAEHRPWMP